jgi:hypothetical protein
MFDPTIREQLARARSATTRSAEASTRPTKFESVSEAQALSFLLKFNQQERVTRFGAVVSDCSIRSWRAKIDRSHYFGVCLTRGRELAGLVELFGSASTGWRRPELALSLRHATDSPSLRLHLVEIGLVAARGEGAFDVFMALNPDETGMRAIVRQCAGTIARDTGIALIPCGFTSGPGSRRITACAIASLSSVPLRGTGVENV